MEKPELKYQIDKCLNLYEVIERIKEKYDIDPLEYGGINFHKFMNKKLMSNVIFPKVQYKDIDKEDVRNEEFIDYESVVEIPRYYDSSKDDETFEETKREYLKRMASYFIASGNKTDEEVIEHLEEVSKHTNFGIKNFEKINVVLEAIYKEYGQYYRNGKVRVWLSRDCEEWTDKEEFDYPEDDKSYKLSEVIQWFDDKYGFDASDLYKWILDTEFVEGRHWERVWMLYSEDKLTIERKTYKKEDAPESLEHVLNILEKDFLPECVKENKDGEGIKFFLDFYQEYSYRD